MIRILIGIAACLVFATTAEAQEMDQIAGALATLGQGLGEGVMAGPSVFVTAAGHAPVPSPIADAYYVNIEDKSPSAVQAAQLHDQRLNAAKALATRFNVVMDIGSTSFAREVDQVEQARHNQLRQAQIQAQLQAQREGKPAGAVMAPGPGSDDADRVFVTRTGVRFRPNNPTQFPAFLDALKAAGIDGLSTQMGGLATPFPLFRSTEVLGFGSLVKVDDSVWDRASADAIATARRQAEVLAKASDQIIGEVKQVLLLSRSVQGSEVTVSVAVRFNFASTK